MTVNKDNQKDKIIRKLRGIVISDKMDKTIVVEIERTKVHPKYKKRYVVNKKYKIHDSKNECKIDDIVEFCACRPISKDKKWRLSTIIEKAPIIEELPEVESELKHKEREQQRLEELASKKVENENNNLNQVDNDKEDKLKDQDLKEEDNK